MQQFEALAQPVDSLAGIGQQSAARLNKLGIFSLQDLLFHLPHRYQDRTRIYPIASLTAGMNVLCCGTVDYIEVSMKGKRSLNCKISDDTGSLFLRFFHFSANQKNSLSQGTLISCFGEIRNGFFGLEVIHPEYAIVNNTDNITDNCLTPIYPLTDGLHQKTVRNAVKQAVTICLESPDNLVDLLPPSLLKSHNYPTLQAALLAIHQPTEQISAEHLQQGDLPALKRLAFEELLAHHLTLLNNKNQVKKWSAPVFNQCTKLSNQFFSSLPFNLTDAQHRVIEEIKQDCLSSSPMLRLVQGDVGSGKTIVAAYAALLSIASHFQVAIMAPTELLAEQHHKNFTLWFKDIQCNISFLTGQLKGNNRKQVMQDIETGAVNIIIGTHALFQDTVAFKQLGLIIIDEQHRFGVHQRLALREKGQYQDIRPHQLVMTATPIPRTLAMLEYSDMDISIIDQLPPGRKPVITKVLPAERRNQIINKITQWTANSHQTYWVCTLIEESEVLQCEAAEKTTEYLSQQLPNVRVALVHGRMKASEKEKIMSDFKNHHYDLLVATTVIEVGVDVPNASLMIIENAERLGLSQLHQLRGRVGRGDQDSFCLLIYQSPLSALGKQRLSILRETNDGFLIAEKDLQLRGPGDVMGTRQTGLMQFKIANLQRDTDLLDDVQQAGEIISQQYPQSIQAIIDRWLGQSTLYSEV